MALSPSRALPASSLQRPLRLAFFGSPALAVQSLDALLARPDLCEVVLVVAQPDKPAGRGRKLRRPAVALRADQAGLALEQPSRVRSGEFPELIESLALDVIVVVAYGRILTTRLLEAPAHGCINLHASLLPAYRGAGPIQWALINGDRDTGVTTMWMEEGLDTGPILLQETSAIAAGETAAGLGERLAALGATLLVDTLDQLRAGTLRARQQPNDGVSLAPLLSAADGAIDWRRPATEIDGRVRGVTPWPGARCGYRGGVLKVLAAHPAEASAPSPGAAVGEVVSVSDHGVRVSCGEGELVLTRVQPLGRKAQDIADFLRGYGLQPGEDLRLPEGK
jgi:methionyl-tRNA formyltransferase